MQVTIQDLPTSERPRERLQQHGAGALALPELLACILGRGTAGESVLITAHRLTQMFDSVRSLSAATVEELAHVRGMGIAKAVQLKAACELGARAVQCVPDPRAPITCAEQAARMATPFLRDRPTEHVIALLLDTKHRLIRTTCIAAGSLHATLVHPREVFYEAIHVRASAMIVAHNHPSGDPTPSAEDRQLTERLMAAGELLGIPVLDHVVIAQSGYRSMIEPMEGE